MYIYISHSCLYLGVKSWNKIRFKDISSRNPVNKSEQCFECRFNKTGFCCFSENFPTQVINLGKLLLHLVLQCGCLGLSHLFS